MKTARTVRREAEGRSHADVARPTLQITLELPAALHRDLTTYAEVLARETGQPVTDPVRLIVPMLGRFIATDRGFAKAKRSASA